MMKDMLPIPPMEAGITVALQLISTIIDLKTGKELNMGTGFDNFTDSAHHSFTNLPKEILENRNLLKSTMEKYGFKFLKQNGGIISLPMEINMKCWILILIN